MSAITAVRVWASLAAMSLLFLWPRDLQAAVASYAVRFGSAAAELKQCELAIADWEHQALIAGIVLVLIATLGGVTAVIQGLQGRWIKMTTVVMGAIVSTATVLSTAALDGDYKTLHNRAKAGDYLIVAANQWLETKDQAADDSDRDLILTEVQTRVSKFWELSGKNSPSAFSSTGTGSQLSPEPLVYAEESTCGCVATYDAAQEFLYFCGTGTSNSISNAKFQATAQAMSSATESLRKMQGATQQNDEALGAYTRRVVSEADSCVKMIDRRFQTSVILRIPRALISPQAQAAFINGSKSSAPDPFAGRWKLNVSRSTMGPFSEIAEEVRDYQRSGNIVIMSWRRVLRSARQTQQGTYELPCDGAEHSVDGQAITCRIVAVDDVEGYQKSSTITHYVRKVIGNTLTISTFEDEAHRRMTSALVFDRVPL